jgi:PHP family Zn ribbon phosphoesterase
VIEPDKMNLTLLYNMENKKNLEVSSKKKKQNKLSDSIEKSSSKSKSYSLDLRIHTPSSLGYISIEGIDTVPALLSLAKVKGLDVIAITDLFTGESIDKFKEAARDYQITVLPGCDLRCTISNCNDVILTCLFPEACSSSTIESFLYQLGVNAEDRKNLRFSIEKDLSSILSTVDEFQGVAFPSRIDKTPAGTATIPLLVEEYGFRTFDLAYQESEKIFHSRWPKYKFKLFTFSNAYALAQIGTRTSKVKMGSPGFEGVKEVFQRERVGVVEPSQM